jgi:hypothetical protein
LIISKMDFETIYQYNHKLESVFMKEERLFILK